VIFRRRQERISASVVASCWSAYRSTAWALAWPRRRRMVSRETPALKLLGGVRVP